MSYNQQQQFDQSYYNYAGWYPYPTTRAYEEYSRTDSEFHPASKSADKAGNNSNNNHNNNNYALTTTRRNNYSYENHPEYNNIARRYESRQNNRFKPYESSYTNHRAKTISYRDNNKSTATKEGQQQQIDHLANLLPGPLAPSVFNDKERDSEAYYSTFAKNFFDHELMHLQGDTQIMYESVRRFGRFEMMEGKVMIDKQEDHVEGLSRLWQVGNGYIYVKTLPPKERSSYRKRNILMTIYQVKKDSYERLEARHTERMVKEDPLWDRVRKDGSVVYM